MKPTFSSGHFLHDAWLVFFAIIVAAGFFMGQGVVIGFGVMGLVAAGIAWFWNRLALEDIAYVRHLPRRRVFLGEEVTMTVALTNKKPVPLPWIRVDDVMPNALEVVEGDVEVNVRPNVQSLHHSTSMAWYERIHWGYQVRCTQRGLYSIGPAQIESGDPFGFLHSRATEPHQDSLLVYPRVMPLPELGLPAARPLGDVRSGMRIFQDPSRSSGLRDYQRGDPLKIVDWKATAKTESLQVRTFEASASSTIILVVAVDTAEPYWAAYRPDDLERVVTAAASVAGYTAEQQYTVGLFSNDMPAPSNRPMSVPPGGGRDQLSLVLGALATIRPFALGPMADHLGKNAHRFPMGATLVVATAFLPPAFVSTLNDLKYRGFKIVVLYVGQDPCPELAESILVYELWDHFASLEAAGERLAG